MRRKETSIRSELTNITTWVFLTLEKYSACSTGWRLGRPMNFWTAAFDSSSLGGSYFAAFASGFGASAISDVEEPLGDEHEILQVDRPAKQHLDHHARH